MNPGKNINTLTGLPYLNSIYGRVRTHSDLGKETGYIFFDVLLFKELQEKYGTEICNKLLKSIGKTLTELKGKLYREDDLIANGDNSPAHFVLLLFSPPRRKEQFSNNDLKLISSRITQRLHNIMRERSNRLGIKEKVDFSAGYAIMNPDPVLEVEKMIRDAHKEAVLRSDMESVMVHLISNISHELRTPLTCIKGYAETLLEGAMADENLCKKFLKIINDEAHRLERLINDLLDLSMIDAQQVQMRCKEMDLISIIEETVGVIHPYARKCQVNIKTEIPDDIPLICADGDRIRQVLINLLDNAIKYSHFGGTVTLKAVLLNKDVRVSIIDEGPGIPEAEKNRVFERFYRVEQGATPAGTHTGRGLGLAIAKYIIESHSGTMSVESTAGKGSAFSFTLPLEEGEGKDGLF